VVDHGTIGMGANNGEKQEAMGRDDMNNDKMARNKKNWPLQFENKFFVIHFFKLLGRMPHDDGS
jgi:hypothetical protein